MNLDILKMAAHSPVRNYVIPGLTSYLIGEPSPKGVVRLFHSSREHYEPIVPHTHRFDFTCFVLNGRVDNLIWSESKDEANSDEFTVSELVYNGAVGKYIQNPFAKGHYKFTLTSYDAGDSYSMQHDEFHSIYFGRDTWVLLIEGPQLRKSSFFLEPFVDGETVSTFEVKPWMFKRDGFFKDAP